MAERDNIEELLEQFKSLGFEGERLEADVRRGLASGLSFFVVQHRVYFGEELMDFELSVKVPANGDNPFLERYKATFRSEIDIDHVRYKNIDTADLEEQMKIIDWQSYFELGEGKAIMNEERRAAVKVIRQLDILDRSTDVSVSAIREKLIYKYWPKDIVAQHRHSPVRLEHDFERSFDSGTGTIPNKNLAYHTASGRLDTVVEKLEKLEFEEYTGIDLYKTLEVILSDNPDQLEIKCSKNGYEGLIDYCIKIHKEGYEFEPECCEVTFISHPSIKHGLYNDVDSLQLEKLMVGIDWHHDGDVFHFPHGNDEDAEFSPKVYKVIDSMDQLSIHPKGAKITDLLRLKYWIGLDFFRDLISSSAWEKFNRRDKINVRFPLKYTAQQMFNLMCGRAVMLKEAINYVGECTWVRVDTQTKDERGRPQLKKIKNFTKNALEKQLDILPLWGSDYYGIRESLASGNLILTNLQNGPNIYISVNPEQSVIELYTPEMVRIPFNFRFDPNWLPEHSGEETKKQNRSKRKKKKRNKGKSL